MESHERILSGIIESALDILFKHIFRHGIVDVKQGYRIAAHHSSDEFAQRPVDIHLAGYRNALGSQAAVHITRHEAKLGLKRRPALASDRYVFVVSLMFFHPVFQRQLVLCQLRKNLRLLIAFSQFLFHLPDNAGNPLIPVMLMKGLEQIQFRILLDLHPQVIQLLDGGIAGKEIQRPWPEADDLQIAQSYDSPGNGQEFMNHIRAFSCVPHRIFRYVSLYVPQFQVIAGIEHSAIGISAAVQQVAARLLCRRQEHLWPVKMLCKQGLRYLRPEVAKIDRQCIAPGFPYVLQCLHHMDLALYNTDRTFIDSFLPVFLLISLHQILSSRHGQTLREAVAADSHHCDLHFWHVTHNHCTSFAFVYYKIIISTYFFCHDQLFTLFMANSCLFIQKGTGQMPSGDVTLLKNVTSPLESLPVAFYIRLAACHIFF